MDHPTDWTARFGVASIAPRGKLRLRPGAGLQGQLDECGILDVVQLLVRTAKTGRLELYPEKLGTRTAPSTVFMRGGNIVHAETGLDGGHDALWKALKITKGEFSFFSGEHDGATTIRENPMMLLMEACRRQDEEAAGICKERREHSHKRTIGNDPERQRAGERSVLVKKAHASHPGAGK